MDKAKVMGYDMGAQTFWRFLPLHELPYSAVQIVNPGFPLPWFLLAMVWHPGLAQANAKVTTNRHQTKPELIPNLSQTYNT